MRDISHPHPNDDLWYAIEYNGLKNFQQEDILDIIAEVPGENDELDWHWVLKLKHNKYAYIFGGCDYTGWDCRSWLSDGIICNTALLAAKESIEIEDYSKRLIRNNLVGQIKGKYPKFTYWPE